MIRPVDSAPFGLVIFDGDDTLWSTQELYDEAKRQFVSLLKHVPEPAETIIKELDTLDAARAKSVGYPRTRFRDSMLMAYQILCDRYGLPVLEATQKTIARLGNDLFDVPPNLYPDTIEALAQLRPFYQLALVTKGDLEIQKARLAQTRLERFFARTYIVPQKTARLYLEVAEELDESQADCWVVGNSAVSDVNPAIEAGMRGILINRATWLHEEGALLVGDVAVVQSLSEAVATIMMRDLAVRGPGANRTF